VYSGRQAIISCHPFRRYSTFISKLQGFLQRPGVRLDLESAFLGGQLMRIFALPERIWDYFLAGAFGGSSAPFETRVRND
jgi:hypothetical protein